MRDPEMKATLLGEADIRPEAPGSMENVYGLFGPCGAGACIRWPTRSISNRRSATIGAHGRRSWGHDPLEYLYDFMLEDGGTRFASLSAVDIPERMNVLREMLVDPQHRDRAL